MQTESIGHVLITGAGGYVGSLLIPVLLKKGYSVTAFDTFYFGKQTLNHVLYEPGLRIIQGDVRTLEPSLLEDVNAVIHLAALSNDPACELEPSLTLSINRDASLRLAYLSKEQGVQRFLFASSCSVYGSTDGYIITEDTLPQPLSSYAKMKLEVEHYLKNLATHTFHPISLRKGTLFGLSPRMRFDLAINIMTLHAATQKSIEITGGGEQWRPFLHVMDAVQAYVQCLQVPLEDLTGSVFNVVAQNVQLWQLGSLISQKAGGISMHMQKSTIDLRSYRVSGQRFETQFAFKPHYLIEDGIDEILEAITSRKFTDPTNPIYYTVETLRHILANEKT